MYNSYETVVIINFISQDPNTILMHSILSENQGCSTFASPGALFLLVVAGNMSITCLPASQLSHISDATITATYPTTTAMAHSTSRCLSLFPIDLETLNAVIAKIPKHIGFCG